MLSDLVQYFTVSKDAEIFENEFTYFLKMVHKNTHSLEIKNAVEKAIAGPVTNLIDVFEYNFNEECYQTDIHLGDALELNFDNNIVTILLSFLMDTSEFEIYYEDTAMEYHFDSSAVTTKKEITIDDYNPYNLNRKINSFINEWTINQIKDCEYDGHIDSYYLECERTIFSTIEFKNKSAGRKIRKAYASNSNVRDMFLELGYFMHNGKFIMLMEYNIESVGYDGCFDMEVIYKGLNELRKHFFHDQSFNEETYMYRRRIKILEKELNKYQYQNYPNFFRKIINTHICSEQEVIL